MNLDLGTLNETQWLEFLVAVARAYKERHARALPITAELGELYACAKLGLRRSPSGTAGYDALDEHNKRVQIKTRAPSSGAGTVNRAGRLGRFHNWDFDYALLVLLDGNYSLQEIWRAEPSALEKEQDKVQNPRAGIHVSDFIRVAHPVIV